MPDKPRRDYLNPSKKCDIVMKGGIASGIVYPNAVSRLAETYRFVSIGGTSAGAIAAAAAAAEYRRAQGSGEGFEKLSALPAFLAAKPSGSSHANLFGLFKPDPAARVLFDLGVSFTRKGLRRVLSILVALLRGVWPVWLLVAVMTALYIYGCRTSNLIDNQSSIASQPRSGSSGFSLLACSRSSFGKYASCHRRDLASAQA